eukprot:1364570-Rhodomonas_salina.1
MFSGTDFVLLLQMVPRWSKVKGSHIPPKTIAEASSASCACPRSLGASALIRILPSSRRRIDYQSRFASGLPAVPSLTFATVLAALCCNPEEVQLQRPCQRDMRR